MTPITKTAPDSQRPMRPMRPTMGALAQALAVQPLRMGLALAQTQRLMRRASARRDHSQVFTGDVGSVSPFTVNQFNQILVQRFSNEAMLRKYTLREEAGGASGKAGEDDLAQAMPLVAGSRAGLDGISVADEDVDEVDEVGDKLDQLEMQADEVQPAAAMGLTETGLPTAQTHGSNVAALTARVQAARAARAAKGTPTVATVSPNPPQVARRLSASSSASSLSLPSSSKQQPNATALAEAIANSPRPYARQIRRFSRVEELSDAQRPGRSVSPAAQPELTGPEQPHNAAPQPATDKATIESAERAQTVRGTSQTADYSHEASQEVTLAEFVQAVQRRALAQAEPQMDAPAASDAEAEAEQVTPTAQPRAVGVTDGSAPAPISVEADVSAEGAALSSHARPMPAADGGGAMPHDLAQPNASSDASSSEHEGPMAQRSETKTVEPQTTQPASPKPPQSLPVLRRMVAFGAAQPPHEPEPETRIHETQLPSAAAAHAENVAQAFAEPAAPTPATQTAGDNETTQAVGASEMREPSRATQAVTQSLSLAQRMMVSAIAKPRPAVRGVQRTKAVQRNPHTPKGATGASAFYADAKDDVTDGEAVATPLLTTQSWPTKIALPLGRPVNVSREVSPAVLRKSRSEVGEAKREQAMQLQREPDETEPVMSTPTTRPAAQPSNTINAGNTNGLDLHALAQQVYPILKRLLTVERERARGF